MKHTQILPTVLIIINVAAAIVYLVNGDSRKFIYWMSAAILTASVTY